jgi:hypothetical protein
VRRHSIFAPTRVEAEQLADFVAQWAEVTHAVKTFQLLK